ncbi:transcriptional regulator, ArsR family [Pelagibacterium luteolum]|uniref:Transcriptional regulator, ArsR family n=2 Tax=Pelagibacterium luteolum TaxID=440168 RepID=A0A1G7TT40_9HYPH|nr:transcriptional regulator, ArsR family [Pelagibacterium luteolum]
MQRHDLKKSLTSYNQRYIKLIGYGMTESERLDATFVALADPTRRAILTRLLEGEASVMELAEPFAMSQPAVSKHIKMLERAGLVSRSRDAQKRPVRIEGMALKEATDWLDHYRQVWEANFSRLDSLLDELKNKRSKEGN